jgi:hypothetical protein
MALLFMDGFDHYVSADGGEKWEMFGVVGTTAPTPRTGAGRAGGTCYKVVPAGDSTCIFGVGAYATGTFSINVTYGASNGNQNCVNITADGKIQHRLEYSGGTVLGETAAGVFRFNVWNYLEVKVFLSQSVGICTVKLNGGTVLTTNAADNCYLANTSWNGWYTGGTGWVFDDFYVCDGTGAVNNDFLGECRVVTLLPQTDAVAAGSNANFTPSTGTDHGALVDEAAPNDDTDYLSSSTVNHVDSWNYPALGYTGTIKGVQMSLSAKKTDSGTRAIAAVTRPVATNRVNATSHYIGTSYNYWMSIWELNPEDAGAWEVADVDGAEFGVKVTV